ncbi:ATP-binding protein [Plantactinospora sp. GCM10030261]|uniref:ATP-binding protein n=1 Tax=Plantactinospora sp. GCM10030261 TaxID=3273420 RepID=UPI0036176680
MPHSFADLLRRHRHAGQLTQESLGERAGISARSVRELERGRAPRPRSVELLANALGLVDVDRAEFVHAGTALHWANRVTPAIAPLGIPHHLPADLPDFVGRANELGRAAEALLDGRLVVISGPPGVGKTALAVHTGHAVADAFPDGQLFALLRDAAGAPVDPADVVAYLLRELGVDGSAVPAGAAARASLFRSRLAGRRILVILDDAASHTQVEAMLPAGPAAAIVTGRLPLTGLPGATALDLRPLPGDSAVELLGRVAGSDRVAAEPCAAAALVEACGGLPLAVRVAGAKLAARPQWTIAALSERLADERGRLDDLRHGDLSVRPGLELIHQGLDASAARAFALLGALPVRSVPDWTVAELLGTGSAEGMAALDQLVDARLLDPDGRAPATVPRYRLHDVTRLFARERREAELTSAQWTAALERAATGWLVRARLAGAALACERYHLDDDGPLPLVGVPAAVATCRTRPLDWFETERQALEEVVTACVDAGLTALARRLAGRCADFYELSGYYDDWLRTAETTLEGCRKAGDRTGEALMLRSLGTALVEVDLPTAASTLGEAKALAAEVGDRDGVAMAGKELGFVFGLMGRLAEAEAELCGAIDGLADDRLPNRAIALCSLGFVHRQRGDTTGAVRFLRRASTIARSCDDPFAQAYTNRGLAGAYLANGQPGPAERAAAKAATLFARIGDVIGAAQGMRVRGEALAAEPGRLADAEWVLRAAAEAFQARGHDWGFALAELSLGEVETRTAAPGAAARLRRSLRYWSKENVPALRARTLVALAEAVDRDGRPDTRLLRRAHRIYRDLSMPAADTIAARLVELEGPPVSDPTHRTSNPAGPIPAGVDGD